MSEFIPPSSDWTHLPSPFVMKRGGALHGARIAFETWGTLTPARDNTIFLLTDLSPDAHAAQHSGNPAPGEHRYPESEMRMARKLGVISYRSALEWDGRFGRARADSGRREDAEPFGLEFEVESYLEGHTRRFVRHFDPNSYLYLSRAMDWFDIGECCHTSTEQGLAQIEVQTSLIIGVHTDILFPLGQQQQMADGLRRGSGDVHMLALPSPQGHDAFLVDIERFSPALAGFLNRLP